MVLVLETVLYDILTWVQPIHEPITCRWKGVNVGGDTFPNERFWRIGKEPSYIIGYIVAYNFYL